MFVEAKEGVGDKVSNLEKSDLIRCREVWDVTQIC